MNLLAAVFSVLLTHGSYDSERVSPTEGLQVKAGGSVYLWGGYEKPSISMVGQSIGKSEIVSAGIGFEHRRQDWYGFLEFGYHWMDPDLEPAIRDEAVWQELTNNHGEPGWYPRATTYHLRDAWGGRIGIGKQYGALNVEARYRWLSARETIHACTTPIDGACVLGMAGSHWAERHYLNFNGFEIGAGVRF